MSGAITDKERLRRVVFGAVYKTPVTDMHTHLYAPAFEGLGLWGVDHLLTYHYLIAETMRQTPLSHEEFQSLDRRAMAEHVWKTLFVDHSPYSEACRGVLTTLGRLGWMCPPRDLSAYRKWYDGLTYRRFVDLVFSAAGVKTVVMTNDPFDPRERELWLKRGTRLQGTRAFALPCASIPCFSIGGTNTGCCGSWDTTWGRCSPRMITGPWRRPAGF